MRLTWQASNDWNLDARLMSCINVWFVYNLVLKAVDARAQNIFYAEKKNAGKRQGILVE